MGMLPGASVRVLPRRAHCTSVSGGETVNNLQSTQEEARGETADTWFLIQDWRSQPSTHDRRKLPERGVIGPKGVACVRRSCRESHSQFGAGSQFEALAPKFSIFELGFLLTAPSDAN